MLKGARALGITLHLRHGGEAWEARLKEGNWAHQFHQERFGRLASQEGVCLQNIVYYQQPHSSHYFVMTAEADSLLRCGALLSKDGGGGESGDGGGGSSLVSPKNVSLAALEAYARKAIGEFAPQLKQQPLLPKQLQIFDFSERRQSNVASLVLPAERFGGSARKRLVVTRVGDALQEPFWPEGLGINRGFLHCLDCADLARGQAALERRRRAQQQQDEEEEEEEKRAAKEEEQLAREKQQEEEEEAAAASPPSPSMSAGPPSPALSPSNGAAVADVTDITDVTEDEEAKAAAQLPARPTAAALPASASPASAFPASPSPASTSASPSFNYDAELRALVQRREDLYTCTKRVSGTTLKSELKPTTDAKRWGGVAGGGGGGGGQGGGGGGGGGGGPSELKYRIDPASRYTHLPLGTDWEPEVTRQREEQRAKMEARRREEEEGEARRRAAAEEELRRRQEALAARYEAEFAAWSEELRAAVEATAAAEDEVGTLTQLCESLGKAAAAKEAEADERRRADAARLDEIDAQLERVRSSIGRHSFAVRDLEAVAATAASSAAASSAPSPASPEGRRATKLAQVQAKLLSAREEAERLEGEREALSGAEGRAEAMAAEAKAALAENRERLVEATARKEATAAALAKLRAGEPERPPHMQAFDGLSA